MSFFAATGEFFRQFFAALPELAPRFLLAWVFTFILLVYGFQLVKRYLRHPLLRLDHRLRDWALTLRYRDRQDTRSDRVLRTWFFRFWTNLASAPSLCVLSLLLPIWATFATPHPKLFYLPGLCFLGSMCMSFVSKRIFKRPRPLREAGSFGHKMKDASFPSGHSLTAFCFWSMTIVSLLLAGLLSPLLLLFCVAGAVIIVFFTGLSRVYLGVHFPTDVFGGYTIALVWSIVCYFVLQPVL